MKTKRIRMIDQVEPGQKVYGLQQTRSFFSKKAGLVTKTEYIVSRKNKSSFYLEDEGSELRCNQGGAVIRDTWTGTTEDIFLTSQDREDYIDAREKESQKREYINEKLENLTEEDREYIYQYFIKKDSITTDGRWKENEQTGR